MLALDDNEITGGMSEIGKKVIEKYGKPKAILAVSAHWFTKRIKSAISTSGLFYHDTSVDARITYFYALSACFYAFPAT